MGFVDYFLIVYDYVKYAKTHDILVGPGRGSAAGSLVSYSIGITNVDPIKYDLLFERFLNPERVTMPDIDIDFEDSKRDEVIDYVKNRYGEDKVANIMTFTTLGARQVIRDVSKCLNINSSIIDKLSNMLDAKASLKDNLEKPYIKEYIVNNKLKELYNISYKLEGLKRQISTHAAGVVISSECLDDIIPIYVENNTVLTGTTMEYLEELGLIKMDFLAIRNLTIIKNVVNMIEKVEGIKLDLNNIPLDDKDTLKSFQNAETDGVFQFESNGMKNLLRKMKPSSFDDIVAAIALFRPGPMENIDTYIKRKNGKEKIDYLDDSLEPILKSTYGIMIYQEQIMQVLVTLADYSFAEADNVRRAMSKKKISIMDENKNIFIDRVVKKGKTKEMAEDIFNKISKFAGYGFNKSHSVVYSIIAYKMTYLKCHYPTIFFANLLTNVIGSESKTNEYIMEARACGIEIEKPNIEDSSSYYVVKNQKIIYPISNIKGVGIVVSEQIEKAKEAGPFLDIYDCFSRLYIAGIGKKILEDFIYANLFAKFGFNRATLIYHLDSLFNYAELTKDIDPSLVMKPELDIQEEYSSNFLLEKEKELFGLYLSSHPITMYKKKYPDCVSLNQVKDYFNRDIIVLVLVDKIKIITTKNGDKMAFVTGSDETGSLEFTFFPSVFQKENLLEKGALLKIKGHVEKRLSVIQIIVETVWHLKEEEYE